MVFSQLSTPESARGQAGFGFLDLLVDGAHVAREMAFSSDSATTSSRRISAMKVHLSLIAGVSGTMVE